MSVLRVVTTRESLRSAYAELAPGTPRATVLTMGALHEGHAGLLRDASRRIGPQGHLTVTIFVNPLQFAPGEDLGRYPRTLEQDVGLCAQEGVDLVFAPGPEVVYPYGDPVVTVEPGPLGTLLEGAVRPGHFRGVLTVVHKLLSMTGAELTVFGEKDFQQLVLVRQMVRDLELPVAVHGLPTVREPDGLALSSRNRYLSEAERAHAAAVPRAIRAGQRVADEGGAGHDVLAAARAVLDREGLGVDYAVVTDPRLGPTPTSGAARLLLAVRVGGVRLLDNAAVELGAAS